MTTIESELKEPITLQDGTIVTFKPFVTRKIAKEFSNRQFTGTEQGENGKLKIKFDMAVSNECNDWLIGALIECATKEGVAVTIDADFIDNLDLKDYELLKKRADALFRPKTDEEKKDLEVGSIIG